MKQILALFTLFLLIFSVKCDSDIHLSDLVETSFNLYPESVGLNSVLPMHLFQTNQDMISDVIQGDNLVVGKREKMMIAAGAKERHHPRLVDRLESVDIAV